MFLHSIVKFSHCRTWSLDTRFSSVDSKSESKWWIFQTWLELLRDASSLLYSTSCLLVLTAESTFDMLKFVDDTAMVTLLCTDEFSHVPAVGYFYDLVSRIVLVQNASKTKDVLINFRLPHSSPVSRRTEYRNGGVLWVLLNYFWQQI